jgi:hypothetical protein
VQQVSGRIRLLVVTYHAAFLAMVVGTFAAVVSASRAAACAALAGAGARHVAHLTFGVLTYRETMRRPWPEVAPLDDGDDW